MKRLSIPIEKDLLEEFQRAVPRGMRAEVIRQALDAVIELRSRGGPAAIAMLLTGAVRFTTEGRDEKRTSENPPDSDGPRSTARKGSRVEKAARDIC